MSFLIGLAGPAKVGKTTTAKSLVKSIKNKYSNLKVEYIAFADMLYGTCSYLSRIPVETLADQSYKEVKWTDETAPLPCLSGWTPRKFLQIVGTECFRNNIDNEFWIQCAIKSSKENDITILSDARFENEFKICDYVIELSREGINYEGNHASALPPPKDLIDMEIHLFPEIVFDMQIEVILDRYKIIKGE